MRSTTQSDNRVRTRELLRDALLSGLRDNFAAHRSLAGELEKLLDEPIQKATYLRYMAMGIAEGGGVAAGRRLLHEAG